MKTIGTFSSNTYVERAFSTADRFDDDKRTNLDWNTFERLVMLHHNQRPLGADKEVAAAEAAAAALITGAVASVL